MITNETQDYKYDAIEPLFELRMIINKNHFMVEETPIAWIDTKLFQL